MLYLYLDLNVSSRKSSLTYGDDKDISFQEDLVGLNSRRAVGTLRNYLHMQYVSTDYTEQQAAFSFTWKIKILVFKANFKQIIEIMFFAS